MNKAQREGYIIAAGQGTGRVHCCHHCCWTGKSDLKLQAPGPGTEHVDATAKRRAATVAPCLLSHRPATYLQVACLVAAVSREFLPALSSV